MNLFRSENLLFFCGIFFILIVNQLFYVCLSFSEIISIAVLKKGHIMPYVYGSLVLVLVFLEIVMLKNITSLYRNLFRITKLLCIFLLLIYVGNSILVYFIGAKVDVILIESGDQKEIEIRHLVSALNSILITVHNILIIILFLTGLKKFSAAE